MKEKWKTINYYYLSVVLAEIAIVALFFFSRFTMDVDFGEATDCIQMPAHNIDA